MSIREINEVRLYGNLVMTPSFQDKTESSQARTYFRMAVNHENRNTDEPWYFDVVCWDRLARAVARWCDKGKEVYVEGNLESRMVQIDGRSLMVCHIRASRIKFGDDSKKNQTRQQQSLFLSSSERPRSDRPVFTDPRASGEVPNGLEKVIQNINPDHLLTELAKLTALKLQQDSSEETF